MATYIKTLKEDNGDITYPQTKAGAVLLNNGSDLETELSQYVTAEDIASTSALTPPVQTNMIADGAVTAGKIANKAVTSDKINWTTLSHVSNVSTSTVVDVKQSSKMLCAVTIPEDGVYFVSATVDPNLLGTDVGNANVFLSLNGVYIEGTRVYFNFNGIWFFGGCHVSAIVSCVKGDKIQLRGKSEKNHWQTDRFRLDAFRIG